ncbi:triggering receptor expressed on myeloid cells 2-like [Leptodactylus fuscus]|uniref:triggering receptor expressed on myeloid cells 2-like n=1 Tax=Leptodactylus fuscus TaxID=238119 RepID=UPI003F4EB6DC
MYVAGMQDKYLPVTAAILLLGISGCCLEKDITVYSVQLGETLNVVCPYQQRADRWKKKIWCKEDDLGFCQLIVGAQPYWSTFKKANVSALISDNHYKGIITVNMTNLQKSDAGVYQCSTVTFGDVSTLQRIQIEVLEDQLEGNVSELENTQYSISGSPSETQIPMLLVIIGSSLISCKLLVLGLIYIWWKKHESLYSTSEDHEPYSMVVFPGDSVTDHSVPNDREDYDDYPQYINYVHTGHLNQAHGRQ